MGNSVDRGRGEWKLRTVFVYLLIHFCRYVINLTVLEDIFQVTIEGWSLGMVTSGPTIVKMQNRHANKTPPDSVHGMAAILCPFHFCFRWDLIGT